MRCPWLMLTAPGCAKTLPAPVQFSVCVSSPNLQTSLVWLKMLQRNMVPLILAAKTKDPEKLGFPQESHAGRRESIGPGPATEKTSHKEMDCLDIRNSCPLLKARFLNLSNAVIP